MVYCIIAGCENRSDTNRKKLRFFTFPKDDYVCKKWIDACGKRKSFKIDCARVCSEHFIESDFKLQDILLNVPLNKRRLQNGAIPSQNLPHEKHISTNEKTRMRLQNKAIVEECLASYERTQEGAIHAVDINDDGLQQFIQTEECSLLKDKTLDEHSYSQIKYYTNGSTQTEFDYDCCKELHIMRLENQNRKLMSIIRRQATRGQENEALRSSLKTIMTTGQIKRLIHPGRKLNWRPEDIASAISLFSSGPMAYAYLRKKNFPLPSTSTLRGWAGKIEIKPGILKHVLNLMDKLNYEDEHRLCVLYFNRIRLKSSSYSDKSDNVAMTRAKYAYVVMARGLIRDWAQIVYYQFDVPVTWIILKSVIVDLDKIKFTVTAVISDVSPAVVSLWEEISISEQQPCINHPCDEYKKIFFFVDTFHLMKTVRYRFITGGFLLYDKQISTKPLKKILDYDKLDLKITHEHLEINKLTRREENLAIELFSDDVSASIKKYIHLGYLDSNSVLECANFIDLISKWFKIFNSKCLHNDSKNEENPYAVDNNILTSISETIRNLKSLKKHVVLHFQNGILLNNNALLEMLNYMTVKYKLTHISTDRLNCQELEEFFNKIRSKGNPQNHPTPLEFKYRLRSSLLGKMIL